ncbi:MAG: hypothetical protein ACE15C_12130 [Phycisphaerae bacterium]
MRTDAIKAILAAVFCFVAAAVPAMAQEAAPKPEDVTVFDFENADDAKAWTNLDTNAIVMRQYEDALKTAGTNKVWKPATHPAEPRIKVELTSEGATSGKQALKITFDGGTWPAITTTAIPEDVDWSKAGTLKADVIVPRPCVVGFCAMQEKSKRGDGYDPSTSRWDATVFLKAGRNEVVAPMIGNNGSMLPKSRGKVVSFDIYMYEPRKGESITVDNIRISKDKPAAAPKVEFTVLGTDIKVTCGAISNEAVAELHKKLKDKWVKADPKTLDEVEADIRKQYEEIKARNPKAVLAVFRDGEKGFDPANPDKVYAGWKDAYVNGHGPDGDVWNRSAKHGKEPYSEQFMRHRGRLMQIDLSTIPAGSNILAARLVQINTGVKPGVAVEKSTMWVAEACNRDWDELEVNAYQFAKEKFWKNISGWNWAGDDPDFLPIFLAYGPSQGMVNVWDFTEAVKFWTDGKHANHGFFWHSDGSDYWGGCPNRKAKDVKQRPGLYVIYEPK